MPRRKSISGVIDPVSLIGVLFLIITLVVGTKVTNDRSMSLNISEKASDCFNECRQDSGRERCNERCGVNVNWKGENVKDTSKVDKDVTKPGDPTCDANGVQYSAGAVTYVSADKNATCGEDGRWNIGAGAITEIQQENVPQFAKETYDKAVEAEKLAAEKLATEQQPTITTSIAEQENLDREKSQCLQEGGAWFANICSYTQQEQAIAKLTPIIQEQQRVVEQEQTTNPFANITTGVVGRTIQQPYVPPLLPTVPTVEDLINKIPGLEKLNINEEETKKTLLSNLASLPTQFSNALNRSKLEGLGTYGLGGGNAYVAPVPQNIIKSQNNSDLYNYMLGNTISAGAGFASATLVTPGAPMFVFETATSIPGAIRLLTAADIADNIVTGGACALGNQESCSYFQSTLFIPAPTGVGNMLVDSIDDFATSWAGTGSTLSNLVNKIPSPALFNPSSSFDSFIPTNTAERFATTKELGLIADLEAKSKPVDMLFAPALDNLPNTPARVVMDDLSRPLPDVEISNPVTTVQDIWRQNIISSDGIILPKLNKSPAEKLASGITGLDIGNPELMPRLIEDHQVLKVKYNLPPREMRFDNPREYINQLKKIATDNGIPVRDISEWEGFFETHSAGAVFDDVGKQIFAPFSTEISDPVSFSGTFEHELIHALQNKRYAGMSVEVMEYEAYITANMTLSNANTNTENIQHVIFQNIKSSVDHSYTERGLTNPWIQKTATEKAVGWVQDNVTPQKFTNWWDEKITNPVGDLIFGKKPMIPASQTPTNSKVEDVVSKLNKLMDRVYPESPNLPECRAGLCGWVSDDVELAFKYNGFKTTQYQVVDLNTARGIVSPEVNSFKHAITVIEDDKGNKYLIDLTFSQFINKETGVIQHPVTKINSNFTIENPIATEIFEKGYIKLDDNILNEYLNLMTSPDVTQPKVNLDILEQTKARREVQKYTPEEIKKYYPELVDQKTSPALTDSTKIKELYTNYVKDENGWLPFLRPSFDTSSPRSKSILADLDKMTQGEQSITSQEGVDEYIKSYGEPKYVFKSSDEAKRTYDFQDKILKIKNVDDYDRIYKETVAKLENKGVKVMVYDNLYKFIDEVGNGDLNSALGTSTPQTVNGKRVATVKIASPSLLKRILEISKVNISEDAAKIITLQKLGHEGGHAFDWINKMGYDDIWLTEIRQKNFNYKFYSHIGSEKEALYYKGFLDEFNSRFGGP